jgi:hypothetical protein
MPEFGIGAKSATDIPISTIQSMKSQGQTNNQIIQNLQKQGYSSTQIFDALSQSAAQPTAVQMPLPPAPVQSFSRPPPPEASDTEELVEAIIDEKWNDLLADINKVISWKEATESRIVKLEQQMADLKDSFSKLQQAVVGKVGEYDQHILEVGAEVKAMEKVFSKVLPVFTDNVAELSRITDGMKKRK